MEKYQPSKALLEKKILIVDDEEQLLELTAFQIEDYGIRCLKASGGDEAIGILQNETVDIIISDITMPNGSGIDLLKSVKQSNPLEPKVIFVTGFSDYSEDEVFHLGAEAMLSKPVNFNQMLRLLDRMIQPLPERKVRENQRLPIELDVQLQWDEYQKVKGKVINIARGGMFIALDQIQTKPGDLLNFEVGFEKESWSPLSGKGEVRWVRSQSEKDKQLGIGIEFLHMESVAYERFKLFLSEHLAIPHIPNKFE